MGRIERIRVEIPYSPRPQFLPFHETDKRFSCLVAHRRAGKTVACINKLIKAALTCPLPDPRFGYLAPFHAQAKDIAWTYLERYTAPIPGVQTNISELRVDFPNGGRVRLYGAENAARLRGLYFDGMVIDEPAKMDPQVWPTIIRPALSDRQGWATFIGTPEGKNAFWEISEQARTSDDWFWLMLKASETGLVRPEELASAREMMTEDQYEQEYECSFDAAIQGAYYGKLMATAEKENRITRVPWEPKAQVHTAWDLGIGDPTAIWFAQTVGKEVRIIDYYETSGVGLDHFVKVLKEKPYVYGDHHLPHDADILEMGTGKTRIETLRGFGVSGRIVPRQSVDDGINAVRMFIPKCWFDAEKCKRGIEALKQYRTEFDEKLQTFKSRPLHDWTSHGADAFRYLAQALRPDQSAQKPLKYPKARIV